MSDRTISKTSKPPPAAADAGYWLGCFFGDDFGHSAMIPENPALSGWDLSGGCRGFDASPSAMGWKADHGVSNTGTGTAGLAGGVAVGRWANRYSPSSGGMPGWARSAVTPFADRLGPLIRPSFEPVPNCARIIAGEHGHDGGDPEVGQSVRMRGVVGRQVDREAGLDGRSGAPGEAGAVQPVKVRPGKGVAPAW